MDGAERFEWLENPQSERTRAFVEAQRARTEGWLAGCAHREAIRARLAELWSQPRRSAPVPRGGRLFFEHDDGTRERAVLCVQDAENAEPRTLLDPAAWGEDGALADWIPSPDGRLLAYAVAEAGSDWRTWRVLDVSDTSRPRDLGEALHWSKFSCAAWNDEGTELAYEAFEAPAERALTARTESPSIRVHRLGSEQSEDATAWSAAGRADVHVFPVAAIPGRWLLVGERPGSELGNVIVAIDRLGTHPPRTLFAGRARRFQVIGSDGDTLLVLTNDGAPRGRLLRVEVTTGAETTILPETDATLVDVAHVNGAQGGGRLVAVRILDAASSVTLHEADGSVVAEIPLPGIGTADSVMSDPFGTEAYFTYESFQQPPMILRLDVTTGRVTTWWAPTLRFDPADFVTRQVLVTSPDGTEVPVFVSQRANVPERSALPAYLYGYGGFNNALLPRFSVSALTWMEMGGVHAHALVRGGGERGTEWHEGAIREKRQNAFDDFMAIAAWLQDSGWAARGKVAIAGHSNGGLLVGACLTQRPELFGAAIPAAGVLDMLRFHRFTIGWGWMGEYGNPDDPKDREFLLAYSPLHNVRPGTRYPPTLVTVSEGDDRVVPSHGYKFAAALQEAQAGDAPILLRIEPRSGHGAGDAVSRIVSEFADRLAFLARVFGMRAP